MNSIAEAFADTEKRFGKGSLIRMSDKPDTTIEKISTGILSIDHIIGGGFPKGRIIEIYGPESSGKSSLALKICAVAQAQGLTVGYIDTEQALDFAYAQDLGVNPETFILAQPQSGDVALEIAETLVRSGEVSVVVVDSVAALITQAEINGEMGDANVGGQARLMSQACRKLVGPVAQHNVCFIFINQLRSIIGGMSFGPTEITSGGKALKFYASLRLDVRKISQIKVGEDVIGNRTKIKVVKNKVAPPAKTCEIDIIFGQGFSYDNDLFDLAVDNKVIDKRGAWFYYNGEQLGQGRDNAKKAAMDLKDELEIKVKEILNG